MIVLSSKRTWVIMNLNLSKQGREEGETVSHLFQRLSILLMKGNMALLLNRFPSEISPEIIGSQQN